MDQVEEVKRKTDIVALVGEYVILKKAGRHNKGLCPFHTEKTPSFVVNEELGIYKCFGCGAGGDVLSFLMEIEGLEFVEALQRLADRVGVKLEFKNDNHKGEREILLEINALAADYFHYILVNHKMGEEARKYLSERKLNKKLIETFKLGFAPSGWDSLSRFLVEKKKYTHEMVVKAGLAIAGRGGSIYDRFRGRVMYPMMDTGGKVVGFSGRVMPTLAHEGEPKYINSPETSIFHKSDLLYGLSIARPFIREKKRVVVVEGLMDMITSYSVDVGETVAIQGTALTAEMVERLARLTDKIILSLDADDAGYAAMKRSLELIEKRGLEIKIAQVEGSKDPDELARQNPKQWRKTVDGAVEVYEFIIRKAFERNGTETADAIKKIVTEVVPFLAKIENTVIREVWVKRLSERLNVSKTSVWDEVEKTKTGMVPEVRKEEPAQKDENKTFKLAKRLIAALLRSQPHSRMKARKVLVGLELLEVEGKILSRLVQEEEEIRVDEWIGALPAEWKGIANECYLMNEEEKVEDREVIGASIELGRELVRDKRKRLVEALTKAEKEKKDDEADEISKELMKLDQKEKEILGLLA